MTLASGTRLGPYEILAIIGAGGMGEVYRARDTRLHRTVAIKVLPRDEFAYPDRKRRFLQEARAASALNHPNIVVLYDIASDRGVDFLIMEYVSGKTLKERICGGAVPLHEVIQHGGQVASALAAAHAAGILHRDIKPANIMITDASQVKVLDFGVAKLMERAVVSEIETRTLGETAPTTPGMVVGTVAYMSPEQTRGESLDGRSDIFSLGCVLYEAATGCLPFKGVSTLSLMHEIATATPVAPSALRPGVPIKFDAVIERALAKDKARRYQSAREMQLDLESVDVAQAPTVPGWKLPSPRWLSFALLLALVLAALAWLAGGRGSGTANIKSLAVLPLENLSADASQEYFADGMTEALITDLGKIGSLAVISRSAVMHYKTTHKPVSEIPRELKVDAIVEGSVLRSGDRVLITAHLVSPANNRQLWSERYDRSMRDVLTLTGEVAQSIAEEIKAKLTQQERARLASRQPVNPDAHEAYLKGRYYWSKVTDEAVRKAIEYFEQASKIDPGYALAYTGLADCYIILGGTIIGASAPQDAMPRAKAAALKALAIDDSLAEAHASLAMVLWRYDWDWSGADKEFRRAIDLNPSYATAHQWYGWYFYGSGRTENSLAELRRAERLDPQSSWISSNIGFAFYFARQYDRAIEQGKSTIEMDRSFVLGYFFLGLAQEQTRRSGMAVAAFQKAVDLSGRSSVYLAALAHAYAVSGKRGEAREVARELAEIAKRKYVPAYETAVLYAGLEDREKAFAWLEKGQQEHSGWMVYLNVDPRLDALRSDPRFAKLVRRIGVPS
jgi:serine/threonine-protein kinase